jgi:adenylate cyclase
VSKIEDIAYAMILDKTGVIKAHTDINKVNKIYETLNNATSSQITDSMEIQKFFDGNREILDFSMPVEFSKVKVGAVHVGISLDTLQEKISKTRIFVASLTFMIILAGIGISFLISTKLSKPIHMLADGIKEIEDGNYDYSIMPSNNDEIGDLTTAFNNMSDGLRKKEIIQDAFGKYVTPEIVDLILQNPDEKWLKGKKFDVTVMFADIRGFTSLSEKTDPEQVVTLLNDHFTMATETIFKYGGHVDKFIGDEIMAVFGAPVEYEDHAARALFAAVALQNEINTTNIKLERLGKNPVKIGIGLNSGEVIAGNIGSQKRMEYTVIGDTVNLASRVTRLAGPDEVIISDFVYKKVSDIAVVKELDPVTVKGKSAPIQTYKVKGLTQQVY